jgi:hypothetical protein
MSPIFLKLLHRLVNIMALNTTLTGNIVSLLLEFYREFGGTFTHDGEEYDLSALFMMIDHAPTFNIAVDRLEWMLAWPGSWDETDEERVDNADLSAPILVTEYQGELAIIDGFHRLVKAVRDGVQTLPAHYVSHNMLEKVKL